MTAENLVKVNSLLPAENRIQSRFFPAFFEGYTTGAPISLVVRNNDQRSHDYSNIKDCYRPGHADYTFDKKYGLRDYRGGGRTSGRETIGRVAGGAVASRILECLGIKLTTYTKAIGPVSIPSDAYDYSVINENRLYMPNSEYAQQAAAIWNNVFLIRIRPAV